MRNVLFNILGVLKDNPNEVVLAHAVEQVVAVCERCYIDGKEMQKKLLRIQLGLAVDSDA